MVISNREKTDFISTATFFLLEHGTQTVPCHTSGGGTLGNTHVSRVIIISYQTSKCGGEAEEKMMTRNTREIHILISIMLRCAHCVAHDGRPARNRVRRATRG